MASCTKAVAICFILCIAVYQLDAQDNRNQNRRRPPTNRNNSRQREATRNQSRPANNRSRGNRGGANSNVTYADCEEIQVPMCKGLVDYTHIMLPNRFNQTTQLEVYRVLEHMWALMDRGCSQNFRRLACSLYLPKCRGGRRPGMEPCQQMCLETEQTCQSSFETFKYSWPSQINCASLPTSNCLGSVPHNPCTQTYTLCEPLNLPMCQGLNFNTGMIPNMFGQCHNAEMTQEMAQFQPLLDSQCSADLRFFLCGVYKPFCTQSEGVLSFPCQELCEDVRDACAARYTQLSGGLPWPNKFQCHRYPVSTNANYTCVMPSDQGTSLVV